jgi:hypothetical protein
MHRALPIAFVVALCALSGVAAYVAARPAAAGWREIVWPFPRDGWPAARSAAILRCVER